MSGKKSLDQIWQQMQVQRAAEAQRQATQERALYEQREIARQEYLKNMRVYERAFVPSSSSSAGAGGGGGLRRIQPTVSTSGQSILYWGYDDGIFSYFIYNFDTDFLSDVKSLNLPNSPSVYPVTEGGFFLESYNGGNSNYNFYFLNIEGNLIWEDTSYDDNSNNTDIENFSRYIAAYYLKDETNWKLVIFDKESKILQFDFENPIEGGGYSYDDVWMDGFVVREEIGDINKYWIINVKAGTRTPFKEIDTNENWLDVYLYAFSDKIVTIENGSLFEVFNPSGQKISDFDANVEFDVEDYDYNEFSFLDDNGSFVIFGFIPGSSWKVILFSGESNSFSYKSFSTDTYDDYRIRINDQKNYRYPENWVAGGSAIFLFYDNDDYINDIDYYENAVILPIWSTDTELRDTYEFSGKGIADHGYTLTRSADSITLLVDDIRGIYFFSDEGDGEVGEIDDGGNDMYDTSNLIYADTNRVSYTHTQLSTNGPVDLAEFISDGQVFSGASGSVFGASSSAEYFTNLYPGLFVLAAKNIEIDEFEIEGNLGADGSGNVDNYNYQVVYNSKIYQVFVKRVWGARDPSVNHIIIVDAESSNEITQSISQDTDDDFHKLEGLASSGVTQIHYLLTALKRGVKLSNNLIELMVIEYLKILDSSSDINELLTNLNSDYSNITGVVPEDSDNYTVLRFNRSGDYATIIDTPISKDFPSSDRWRLNGKTVVRFDLDDNEYGYYIFGLDGNIIDEVVTTNEFNQEYRGSTFILIDYIAEKVWVSNNQDGKQFQLLDEYYDSFQSASRISIETGLIIGNFISNYPSEATVNYRIITEESISANIDIAEIINNTEVSYNGAIIVTGTDPFNFYLYNLGGQLIDQRLDISSGYDLYSNGNRTSITYNEEGSKKILLFNGTAVKEATLNVVSIEYSLNDWWYWWD